MMPFVLADHPLISAVPFLVPAAIILGFLAFYVIRDRRSDDVDETEVDGDVWGDPEATDPSDGDR